jgi:hypothetical protein
MGESAGEEVLHFHLPYAVSTLVECNTLLGNNCELLKKATELLPRLSKTNWHRLKGSRDRMTVTRLHYLC